jgi:MFS family permease
MGFRNAASFILEPGLFIAAMSCVGITTVLPPLVQRLTGSTVAVGLVTGLATGVYLLPQLLIAGVAARMRRKKPLAVAAVWAGRPLLLLIALALWTLGPDRPLLAFVLLAAGLVAFHACEAVQAVPWLALLGSCVPPERRGRVLGAAQVLGGIGGVAAGALVRWALGGHGPWTFPRDYAALFAAAGAGLVLSAAAMSVMREPGPAAAEADPPTLGAVLARLPGILWSDRPFLRLVATRVLSDFVMVAGAFYVLRAGAVPGITASATGLFVSAQVLGGLASGFLMAGVHDRWGPLTHLRVTVCVSLIPPALALAAEAAGLAGPALLPLYLGAFFFLGLYLGAPSWPFLTWALEHAPEPDRPLFIGIMNTLGALAMLAAPLGGWMAARLSYPAVFGLAAAFGLGALALARGLPETRL